jgi:hypothetical protein
MPEVQRLLVKEDDQEYEIYIESNTTSDVSEDDEPGYRDGLPTVDIKEVHKKIRDYTRFVMGAFKEFSTGEVEEITLKFGLKIGGKTGIPILAEGSTEGTFEIEVKSKFPNTKNSQSS